MWLWLCILTSFQNILLGFPPTAARAECQQVVPAGDSPLIYTLSSTHHAEKPISIGECWMVIGWCKKLNNEAISHQRTQPFIIWCFMGKTPFCTLFWKRTTCLPPSSGLEQCSVGNTHIQQKKKKKSLKLQAVNRRSLLR